MINKKKEEVKCSWKSKVNIKNQSNLVEVFPGKFSHLFDQQLSSKWNKNHLLFFCFISVSERFITILIDQIHLVHHWDIQLKEYFLIDDLPVCNLDFKRSSGTDTN